MMGDKGQIFYTKPDVRQAGYLPSLKEVESEARESLAKQKALEAIEKAAKVASDEVNGGKKDLAALAAAGLDVEIAGEKVHLDAAPVQSSATYVAKDGAIMVPKKKSEKPEDTKPVNKDDDTRANEEEETHPASKTLLGAVFTLPDGDRQKTSVASDSEVGACYIARFDDVQLPNPAGFEKQKDQLERTLLQESSRLYFAKWRSELLKEVRG